MKKYFILMSMLLLTCSFCGCRQSNPSSKHLITMHNSQWLFEKIPSSARTGDTVNVKISKAYDVGYMFTVNGKKSDPKDDTDEYWLLSFTMPDEDVEIYFHTYNGFLPNINYSTLIETFWMQNPKAEYVSIREYYGDYASGSIAAMIDWCDYTSNLWSETVAGCEFLYGDGNRLTVLYGDTFYSLAEAHKNGYLTDTDVLTIFNDYKKAHSSAYKNHE